MANLIEIAATTDFCARTANIWQILGYVVLVIKIVIPLLLIIFGMVDLGKAVVSSDDGAIKSATNSLIKRFIAAIAIFFVPTLVSAVFNLIGIFGEQEADYNTCIQCVTDVGRCKTDKAIKVN